MLRVADTATGEVRQVLEEKAATQFESRGWRVVWNANEVIWHSERDNWGQLYLYDLQSGRLKHAITTGEGPVMQIARVDDQARTIWFGANGRESGQDPYFLHFYRASLDGGAPVSLTPDDGTHAIQLSDFFKAGIAESGNHDQRVNEDDWGERYQGLVVKNGDGTDSYEAEANQLYAKNLKGHLMLAHGTMDTNVPPYQTMLVADALIKANKDFDLLMIPNANHGYGAASNYMMRRRWDCFVRWLMGVEPPSR